MRARFTFSTLVVILSISLLAVTGCKSGPSFAWFKSKKDTSNAYAETGPRPPSAGFQPQGIAASQPYPDTQYGQQGGAYGQQGTAQGYGGASGGYASGGYRSGTVAGAGYNNNNNNGGGYNAYGGGAPSGAGAGYDAGQYGGAAAGAGYDTSQYGSGTRTADAAAYQGYQPPSYDAAPQQQYQPQPQYQPQQQQYQPAQQQPYGAPGQYQAPSSGNYQNGSGQSYDQAPAGNDFGAAGYDQNATQQASASPSWASGESQGYRPGSTGSVQPANFNNGSAAGDSYANPAGGEFRGGGSFGGQSNDAYFQDKGGY